MFEGVNWTTVFVALLNLLVGGLLVQFVRTRPTLKKIANEREANLLSERATEMEAMRERIEKLEQRIETDKEKHDAEREADKARHDAERSLDRHRINNLQQCLDSLLLLIETDPAKAAEAAKRVREMRARQLEAEAREKGEIHAAIIKEADGRATA